jgi:hypothetical protein
MLALGNIVEAAHSSAQAVDYADRTGDPFIRELTRSTRADALHQAGHRREAAEHFCQAEELHSEPQLGYPLKYSLPSFQYCDLLLTEIERDAWRATLGMKFGKASSETIVAVSNRAMQTLKWVSEHQTGALDVAFNHLTLGRVALYSNILNFSGAELPTAIAEVDAAMESFRHASDQDVIPLGLLTRAWLRHLVGNHTGPESAQADLDEAWEIAERGPMRLFLADIHLHRARLFGRPRDVEAIKDYPWGSPMADLAAARRLIESCGYNRRKEELEEAEAGWSEFNP